MPAGLLPLLNLLRRLDTREHALPLRLLRLVDVLFLRVLLWFFGLGVEVWGFGVWCLVFGVWGLGFNAGELLLIKIPSRRFCGGVDFLKPFNEYIVPDKAAPLPASPLRPHSIPRQRLRIFGVGFKV